MVRLTAPAGPRPAEEDPPPRIERLFERNRAWADRMAQADPACFAKLARGQKPGILWIGCSDSRAPPERIVDLPPGELFVHRNIANVVVQSDPNCLSVLQYAVEALKVRHVVVCGHDGCGGVRAALAGSERGPIGDWLNHVRLVHRLHRAELDSLAGEARERRLCELNAIEQVRNAAESTVVRAAWAAGAGPDLHGWIYGLDDGRLRPLCTWRRGDDDLRLGGGEERSPDR